MSDEPYIIVSDESGIEQTIQSVCFVAGPCSAARGLNKACRKAIDEAGTSEIKFKNIDDSRKQAAAKAALTAFLDCPHCRAMSLTWSLADSRHQVQKRDNEANFHRMLFHGLRSVADWFGDVEWNWYHDQNSTLDQDELQSFLNNTRGYKSLSSTPVDIFGDFRHVIRFSKVGQRCSKETPLIGLSDLLAGAARHSVHDGAGCVTTHLNRGGQGGFDYGDADDSVNVTRAVLAKRAMVSHIKEECDRRSLGVSLESTKRLATHQKGDKVWFWHYEPQGDYDKAPVKSVSSTH